MIPEEIKCHRPTGTEIHKVKDRYYVYRTQSVWDPEKKRPRKKTGEYLGKITAEDGFIPKKEARAGSTAPVLVREYGVWAAISQLLPDLRGQLDSAFGADLGDRCYAVAMLRLAGRATKARMSRCYSGSWLCEDMPGLALSENTMTSFMRELGSRRGQMMDFMRARMPHEGSTLLFDGTAILSGSAGMTIARNGRSGKRQLNVMYVFDVSTREPAWYRVLPGNIADVAAFEATLRESGATSCVAVADKGFFSKANVGALDAVAMDYVLPLRQRSTLVDTSFLDDGSEQPWEGIFEYHGRAVRHITLPIGGSGKHVVVFRDDGRRSQLMANWARRMGAGYTDGEEADPVKAARNFGVSMLYTNLDSPPEELWNIYKSRWEIEEMFDYLKNGLDLGCVYQRTDTETEAWAFLNHITLTMFYALRKAIVDAGLPSRWTAEAVLCALRNVNRVKVDGQWRNSEVSKTDLQVFESIGVVFQ